MSAPVSNFWKLKILQIKDIHVFLHFSTCIFFVWLCLNFYLNENSSSSLSIVLGAFYIAFLVREIPRFLILKYLKVEILKATIYPFNIFYAFKGIFTQSKSFLFAIIGIFSNLLLCGFLYNYINLTAFLSFQSLDFTSNLANFSFLCAAIQLIPIYPFDTNFLVRHFSQSSNLEIGIKKALKIEFVIIVSAFVTACFFFLNTNIVNFILCILLLIPAFQNRAQTKLTLLSRNYSCKEAMFDFQKMVKIKYNMTVSSALNLALKVPQNLFPVFNEDTFIGTITRDKLIGSAITSEDTYITEITDKEFKTIQGDLPLSAALTIFNEGFSEIIVLADNNAVGILTQDHLQEFAIIKEAIKGINFQKNFIDEGI